MGKRWMWIVWPGFLMAIPAVGLVFSFVDPADVHLFGERLETTRLGAYTIGFLFFWIMGAACSALTCMLQNAAQADDASSSLSRGD